MNKYIYHSIIDTLALIAMTVIIAISIHYIIEGAVSSGAFFNAIGSLFTGILK